MKNSVINPKSLDIVRVIINAYNVRTHRRLSNVRNARMDDAAIELLQTSSCEAG